MKFREALDSVKNDSLVTASLPDGVEFQGVVLEFSRFPRRDGTKPPKVLIQNSCPTDCESGLGERGSDYVYVQISNLNASSKE